MAQAAKAGNGFDAEGISKKNRCVKEFGLRVGEWEEKTFEEEFRKNI